MNSQLDKYAGNQDTSLDQEVLVELVELHARMLMRMPVIQVFVVVGLGLLIFPFVSAWEFFGWSALTLTIEIGRAVYAAKTLRHKSNRGTRLLPTPCAKHTHFWFVVLAAAAGGAIAVAAALFFPKIPILQQAGMAILLCGIPSAGVAVSQSSRYILGAYALSILVPSAYVWGLIYPSQMLALVSLGILYSAVLILVSVDGEKLIIRSVIIRRERDQLVKDLEQRNADVREALTKVEQSAQTRARVLAAASHDLRQPLHALSIYSAVLAANPTPETLQETGRNIDQIVRSLGSLLGGLLDLSRWSANYYVPDKKVFSLDKAVNDVCSEFQAAIAAKNLVLYRALPPVTLCGDVMAVSRIARNLLDNAIKYTEEGEIRVEIRIEGTAAILTVMDTGKGIPLAEQTRVFEEFYQLDNPGRDRSKGVGLGLAIVQRLCELIEANVSLTSEPGQGAHFCVTFPQAVTPATDMYSTGIATPSLPLPLKGNRVYVVDDEIDILKSMSALLKAWGIAVETAISATTAEHLFQQFGNPDLLIADLRLGGDEHGAALADRLQRDFGPFPVLIITGEISSEALRQANEKGYPLLQKPIAPEVLRDAIAKQVLRNYNDI